MTEDEAMRALEGWVADYQPAVYRAAVLILGDPHAAQDVAQETFIRAYRAAPRLRPGSQVRPWLYKIATNLALTHLRSAGREQRALRRIPPDVGAEADPAERRSDRDAVSEALGKLSDRLRVCVILRYYADLSEGEVAHALRIPLGTVKSRLHQARTLLASDPALIGAHAPDDPPTVGRTTDDATKEVDPR